MKLIGGLISIIISPAHFLLAPLTRRARVVMIKENKVLLARHWIGFNKWSLPGGGLKRGESVLEAAKREINEELSVEISKPTELHESPLLVRDGMIWTRLHFVKAQLKDGQQMNTNWEISECEWFSVDELPKVTPDVGIALDLVSKK